MKHHSSEDIFFLCTNSLFTYYADWISDDFQFKLFEKLDHIELKLKSFKFDMPPDSYSQFSFMHDDFIQNRQNANFSDA